MNSALRSQIVLLLAQACETWWSLSLASANDDYADRGCIRMAPRRLD